MKYYILKCSVNAEDYNEDNYGIMLLKDNNSKEYTCNITSNQNEINELVDKLNNFHIEPCHMNSVIEDFKYEIHSK